MVYMDVAPIGDALGGESLPFVPVAVSEDPTIAMVIEKAPVQLLRRRTAEPGHA